MTSATGLADLFERFMDETRAVPECADPKVEKKRAAIIRRFEQDVSALRKMDSTAAAVGVAGPSGVCPHCGQWEACRRGQCRLVVRKIPPVPQMDPSIITQFLGIIKACVRQNDVFVLCSETGTGKTTRVPWDLAADLFITPPGKKVFVALPRRIAAKEEALFVANKLLETELEDQVGYCIGQDKKFRDTCSLVYCTVGVIWSRLRHGSFLDNISVLVLDEVHTRSIELDMILSVWRDYLWQGRTMPKLVICSATLSVGTFVGYYRAPGPTGSVPLKVEHKEFKGRKYHVTDRRAQGTDETVLNGVPACLTGLRLLVGGNILPRQGRFHNILVFLPEKKGCDDLRDLVKQDPLFKDYSVFVLYRGCKKTDYYGALNTGNEGRRITIATNIAETSLTPYGLIAVVNSGLTRVKYFRSGIESLELEHTNVFDNLQRAGRGREIDTVHLSVFDPAKSEAVPLVVEMQRGDIRMALLALFSLKHSKHLRVAPDQFGFLSPPSEPALAWAMDQLWSMGLVRDGYSITALGRMVNQLPVGVELALALSLASSRHCLDVGLKIVAVAQAKQESDVLTVGEVENEQEKLEKLEKIHNLEVHLGGAARLYYEAWHLGVEGPFGSDLVLRNSGALNRNCIEKAKGAHKQLTDITGHWVQQPSELELTGEAGVREFEKCLIQACGRTLARHHSSQPAGVYTLICSETDARCKDNAVEPWSDMDHFIVAMNGLFALDNQAQWRNPKPELREVVIVTNDELRELVREGNMTANEKLALDSDETNFMLCEGVF